MKNSEKIIVGVLGLPIRKKGQEYEFFLTQRVAPNRLSIHLKWQLSGGEMEFGETPQQTIIREFQEELSVTPDIRYPHPIVVTNTWRKDGDTFSSNVHLLLLAFIVEIGDQHPINSDPDHETGEMRWFTETEIAHLDCLPNTQHIISQALQILR